MEFSDIQQLFGSLYADISVEEEFYNVKPLMAHYTSLEVLEKILTNNEIWFSSPLYMNDRAEVLFGINNGAEIVKKSAEVELSLGNKYRHRIFCKSIDDFISEYDKKYLLDTYVFCTSEHQMNDHDGLLSMWRGYGGHGDGVAIVIDSSKIEPSNDTPFVISKVKYGTDEDRLSWIRNKAVEFSRIISEIYISDEDIRSCAFVLFDRIKLFSLFTKHIGFSEENEWRFVYRPENDRDGRYSKLRHYVHGPLGFEPKLKFKLEPTDDVTSSDFSFEKIIHEIILGPTMSTPLAMRSVERMFELVNRPRLKEHLIASTIPFRRR